jgi:hypothetical protein
VWGVLGWWVGVVVLVEVEVEEEEERRRKRRRRKEEEEKEEEEVYKIVATSSALGPRGAPGSNGPSGPRRRGQSRGPHRGR